MKQIKVIPLPFTSLNYPYNELLLKKDLFIKTGSTNHEINFIVPFIHLKQNTRTISCFPTRSQLIILGP